MIFAYLDPGSGSALVGTLIAVAGAAVFSLKSFVYRLLRKGDTLHSSPSSSVFTSISLFSEGKNYWGTFRLIIEELISCKIHFSYYTMDLHDPALLIDNEYMHSKLFDHRKAASYHKLSNLKAKVLLATTPNIGTPGYPIKRSPNVEKMLHVFHAFADCSAYHIGSLDNYDTVLTVGPHQEKPIREVERARNLKAKEIIPVGLPYFDAQYLAKLSNSQTFKSSNSHTILIAPSWGAKGLLSEYGIDFVLELAKSNYNIIIRPHPQSYIAEPQFIAECQAKTAAFPNVIWDAETIGTKSMFASDLLISDTSSIRYDYAFLYKKPVITLDIPRGKQTEYEGQFQFQIWTDAVADKLGRVITHSTISNLSEVIKEMLSPTFNFNFILQLRNQTITNLGTSAQAIVDLLVKEAANV